MKDEDFYKSLAGEIGNELNNSEIDVDELDKTLQDLDDIDANLFGKNQKTSRQKKNDKSQKQELHTDNTKLKTDLQQEEYQNSEKKLQSQSSIDKPDKFQKPPDKSLHPEKDDILDLLFSDDTAPSIPKNETRKTTPLKSVEDLFSKNKENDSDFKENVKTTKSAEIFQKKQHILSELTSASDDFVFGSYQPSILTEDRGLRKLNSERRGSGGDIGLNVERRGSNPFTYEWEKPNSSVTTTKTDKTPDKDTISNTSTSKRDVSSVYPSQPNPRNNGNNTAGQTNKNTKKGVSLDWLFSESAVKNEIPLHKKNGLTNNRQAKSEPTIETNKFISNDLATNANNVSVNTEPKRQTERKNSFSWLDSGNDKENPLTTTSLQKNVTENQRTIYNGIEKAILQTSEIAIQTEPVTFVSELTKKEWKHENEAEARLIENQLVQQVMNEKNESLATIAALEKKVEALEKERIELTVSLQKIYADHQKQIEMLMESHRSQLQHVQKDSAKKECSCAKEVLNFLDQHQIKVTELAQESLQQKQLFSKQVAEVQTQWLHEIRAMRELERDAFQDLKHLQSSIEDLQAKTSEKEEREVTIDNVNSLNEAVSICMDLLKQQSYEITTLKMELERNQWMNSKHQTILQMTDMLDNWSDTQNKPINVSTSTYAIKADYQSQDLLKDVECIKIAEKIREEGLAALEQAKKLKNEQEVFKSSVQKQLQALHKKELYLSKSRSNSTRKFWIESEKIPEHNNEEHISGINSTSNALDNKTRFPFNSTDVKKNVLDSSMLGNIFYANACMYHPNNSGNSAKSNFEFNVVSWRMAADHDRQILENEKHYLNSLSKFH